MNQIKKPNSGPNYDLFDSNLEPQIFSAALTSTGNKAFFEAIILCNLEKNQCSQLKKMAINQILDTILACFTQIWTPKSFRGVLPILVVRHCSSYAIQRKTNKPSLRKWQKKLILGLILACFGPNLVTKTFFRGFTSTRCQTLLQTVTECNFKEN